jgi:L-seryl-tRNA(Ser) seleniumtransferase
MLRRTRLCIAVNVSWGLWNLVNLERTKGRWLPSVDAVLRTPFGEEAALRFNHGSAVGAIQRVLQEMRSRGEHANEAESIAHQAVTLLEREQAPRQRRVFNLTGTLLHTNLGRAVLAENAIAAAVMAMRHPTNLEYNIGDGKRGERDDHVIDLIRTVTGAEDAVIVNNNAAAVFLVLNTLAKRRHVIVSRGELVEIGGSFRIPDIMASAGAKLCEVGTTNRTHLSDYESAIDDRTAMLMRVHTSNYIMSGFVSHADARDLIKLAGQFKIPFIEDLGSGTLVDLSQYGLRRERTVQDACSEGVDVVTFSGDKLLGGPQAGIIVGRSKFITKIRKNPLKRTLRLDKIRLAALEATLSLYRDPAILEQCLPTYQYFTRDAGAMAELALRIKAGLELKLGNLWNTAVVSCSSQIGSGALPSEQLESAGIAIKPVWRRGQSLEELALAFRRLPIPCIGRLHQGSLVFDLRALDDELAFLQQIQVLDIDGSSSKTVTGRKG